MEEQNPKARRNTWLLCADSWFSQSVVCVSKGETPGSNYSTCFLNWFKISAVSNTLTGGFTWRVWAEKHFEQAAQSPFKWYQTEFGYLAKNVSVGNPDRLCCDSFLIPPEEIQPWKALGDPDVPAVPEAPELVWTALACCKWGSIWG